MNIKHISLLSLIAVVLTSCSSHTAKVKEQLGDKFDNQVYESVGGEVKSKERYKLFCEAIKKKKHNKITLQITAMQTVSSSEHLQLVDAEIKLADKDCK